MRQHGSGLKGLGSAAIYFLRVTYFWTRFFAAIGTLVARCAVCSLRLVVIASSLSSPATATTSLMAHSFVINVSIPTLALSGFDSTMVSV